MGELLDAYALRNGAGKIDAGNPLDVQAAALEVALGLILAELGGTLSVALPTGAATSARQDSAKAVLDAILAALGGSLSVTGPLTDAQLAARGLATETKLEAVRALLAGTLTATLAAGTNLIGKVAPSADQDPVFDEASGGTYTLAANTSTILITPPVGCKFMRISVTADTLIRTDNQVVSDNGKNAMIWAGTTDTIPVTAGTALRGFSTSASVVRCLPLKERA